MGAATAAWGQRQRLGNGSGAVAVATQWRRRLQSGNTGSTTAAMAAAWWRWLQLGDSGGTVAAQQAARQQCSGGGRIASVPVGGGGSSTVRLWGEGSSFSSNSFNKS